jgi:hypothetical protein
VVFLSYTSVAPKLLLNSVMLLQNKNAHFIFLGSMYDFSQIIIIRARGPFCQDGDHPAQKELREKDSHQRLLGLLEYLF